MRREKELNAVLTGKMVVNDHPAKASIYVGNITGGCHLNIHPSVLQGAKGETGLSAYEIAVKHGYKGTEEEFALSFQNILARHIDDVYYDDVTGMTCDGHDFGQDSASDALLIAHADDVRDILTIDQVEVDPRSVNRLLIRYSDAPQDALYRM